MNIEELEKRVRAIEDLEAIKKMHQDYMSCLDNIQFEKALDFFIDDAEVEVRNSGIMKGRENYSKIYLGTLARRKERHDGHLIAQPDIIVDGDSAKGTWLVYIFFSVPEIDWVQGVSTCEYVKVNGRWKLSKLKFARTLASKPELYP